MNYDQARMLGEASDAPGKWNWTTMNDHVIWTTSPCFYPDVDWSMVRLDPLTARPNVTLEGRPRCDHDTREEAERHQWGDHIDRTVIEVIEAIDLDTARERRRCDYPDCSNWEDHRTHEPGGYGGDSLCDAHASHDALRVMHPFHPGSSVIHS